MQRYGIEDEAWFEAARTALERRGFRLRLQARSMIIDKDGRLPRIVSSAREFLEFAERQGLPVAPAAYAQADRFGDGRTGDSPFDLPTGGPGSGMGDAGGGRVAFEGAAGAGTIRPDTSAVEARLTELRAEQARLAHERRGVMEARQQLEVRCAALEAELARASAAAVEAATQRDFYQLSAQAAEARLRAVQAELDGPAGERQGGERGTDRKFHQLKRFLARELHPDLAGEDAGERVLREAIFKRVWARIEQLQ